MLVDKLSVAVIRQGMEEDSAAAAAAFPPALLQTHSPSLTNQTTAKE